MKQNIFDTLKEIQDSIDVIDYTVDGKCVMNCGQCCADMIPLTKNEAKQIALYVKKHGIKQERWIVTNEQGGEDIHMSCPFLNKETKACNIYPVRPLVCQQFMCNKPKDVLASNKQFHLARSYYNSFSGHAISLHRLFYGDEKREIEMYYSMYRESNTTMSFEDFLKAMRVEGYMI